MASESKRRRRSDQVSPREALEEVRGGGGGFVWIGLHEPSERVGLDVGMPVNA